MSEYVAKDADPFDAGPSSREKLGKADLSSPWLRLDLCAHLLRNVLVPEGCVLCSDGQFVNDISLHMMCTIAIISSHAATAAEASIISFHRLPHVRQYQSLAQVGHRPHERLERSPIQPAGAVGGHVHAKVGVDLPGAVGVEDELATELEAGVDPVALPLEVLADNGDALLVGEGRRCW